MMKSNLNIFKVLMCVFLILFSFNNIVFAASDFDCNTLGNFKHDLQYVFDFMKVLLPLLVIGLSSYDFIKAITAKDEKDVKKAFQKLIKRFIYAVLLFFLPVILNFILDLAMTDSSVCIN